MRKKNALTSIFVLGISSIITQSIIIREAISTFYGNEFFIGIILAAWLGWIAFGSGFFKKYLNKSKQDLYSLVKIHFWIGWLFLLEIFLIRIVKLYLGLAGEIPNLIHSFVFAFIIPAPLCITLGLWWTIASKIISKLFNQNKIKEINKAYFLEIIGFIIGGFLFSFWFIRFNEFFVALILLVINLSMILLLVHKKPPYFLIKIFTSILIIILIFLSFSPYLKQLNTATQSLRFKNQELLATSNSYYGNIAVTKIDSQHNFYLNNKLIYSDKEALFYESFIHLSLLHHSSPKKILLIGNNLSQALEETLKHNPDQVYYVEPDKQKLNIFKKYISKQARQALKNDKVKIINKDAFYFLNKTNEQFDFIIINIPNPSTAHTNRFYTQEFIQITHKKLANSGIIATHMSSSLSSMTGNLANLNASLYKTLKQVFPRVSVLADESNLFLGHKNPYTGISSKILSSRISQRNINTKFINKDYIKYRMTNPRSVKMIELFDENKQAATNKMFKPIAYFYQNLFWLDHFYLNFSKLLKTLSSYFWEIFAMLLLTISLYLSKSKQQLLKKLPIISIIIGGFCLMALEIITIFTYQSIIGHIYLRISLLISVFFIGMALGIFYGQSKKDFNDLIKMHLILIIFPIILIGILPLLINISHVLSEIIILIILLMTGFIGAAIFPISNNIFLLSQTNLDNKTGTIYSADLIGSMLGCLLPSLILIPIFGIINSLAFISIINLWFILILSIRKPGP
ncbi:hypothetical protein ISS06_00375 [Patescibacteria group bacterium]|nr:hypothetical protein [Patescibacteria group bacterium]